jgi:hypothetical protein
MNVGEVGLRNMEYQWRTGCGAAFGSAKEEAERD